jgi:hypothetical protein
LLHVVFGAGRVRLEDHFFSRSTAHRVPERAVLADVAPTNEPHADRASVWRCSRKSSPPFRKVKVEPERVYPELSAQRQSVLADRRPMLWCQPPHARSRSMAGEALLVPTRFKRHVALAIGRNVLLFTHVIRIF